MLPRDYMMGQCAPPPYQRRKTRTAGGMQSIESSGMDVPLALRATPARLDTGGYVIDKAACYVDHAPPSASPSVPCNDSARDALALPHAPVHGTSPVEHAERSTPPQASTIGGYAGPKHASASCPAAHGRCPPTTHEG